MNNNIILQGLVSEKYTAIYAIHSNIDDKNNSNEFQFSQCKQVASKINLAVYKSYEDEGSGFSESPENRNGFKQLLIDAKTGYFKNLIVWKMDRIWGQSYDYTKAKKLLESYDINLIFSDTFEILQGLVPENYTAIYARHSNIDDKNNSNENQINQCKQVASKLNLVVYKSYEDDGSGFSVPPENRNGFKQLLIDAKSGYFKNLIIWKIDRLWRQSYDYPKTKTLLESYGVKLIFSDMLQLEGMDPLYKNFMTNMFISIAELEPNRIREKTVNGRNFKRTLGIVFLRYISFGYNPCKKTAFINSKIPNPDIAKSTKTYYNMVPLEAAFINTCFRIYNNSNGNYNNKIEQIKIAMNAIKTLFENVTLENFKDTVESISNKTEISPIKNELINPQDSLSIDTLKKIKKDIKRCCSHCTNVTILEQMLINHHYCGINVIKVEDNDKLLIFDEKHSHYILNHEVYNNAVNIDIIVDKDLWFSVATDILNYRRLKPVKDKNTFNSVIKCGKCKIHLEVSGDFYECQKCGIQISLQEIKEKIIDQLIDDNFFGKVTEQVEKHNNSLTDKIKLLEKEIKTLETDCVSYTFKYISEPCKEIVEKINTTSEKSKKSKKKIANLQHEKESYKKYVTKQLFKTEEGWDNLKDKLNSFFIDEESKTEEFLNSIIKGVIIVNDKVKNKYIKITR